jgi:hypothetical protein
MKLAAAKPTCYSWILGASPTDAKLSLERICPSEKRQVDDALMEGNSYIV